MEDLLQDRVKECISDFRDAGIKVWMLTGDKGDTAHQIAYTCGLYTHDEYFKVFKIDEGKNPDVVIDQMNGLKDEAQFGLTVGATSLIQIMAATEDGEIKGERALKMLKIIDKSRAIVVYRCSPGQKAQITQIVKDNMKDAITLAIGDGANDVNMIQQAHIGVGVFGKEGNQAACFSDYAIP